MLPIILMACAIWGVGAYTKTPNSLRWTGIGILYAAVLIAHVALPDGSALRTATGGSSAPWLVLAGTILIVIVYRKWLTRMKKRASSTLQVVDDHSLTKELERNARHIVLREIGGPGQKRLKQAKVLVVGAGGLGSPVLSYLAAAGVGTIGVIDDDVVDNSNLQRQIIHTDANIGTPKVISAKTAMEAQNPSVIVRTYNRRLTPEITPDLFADYDLILDGTDNFDTRYLVNEAAVAVGKPLISGALTQWEGQLSTFDPKAGGPCYQCIFPEAPAPGLVPACAEAGVVGPLPGVIGSMMAIEAIKELTKAGDSMRGRLFMYDALYGETRSIAIDPRPDCKICEGRGAQATASAPT